jgi:hypothetical protein
MNSSDDESDSQLDAVMASFSEDEIKDLSALLEEELEGGEAEPQFLQQHICVLFGLVDSSSEDEEEEKKVWGGSRPGEAKNKNRDFVGANQRVMANYFSGAESKYDESDFEKRFRMPREIFERICQAVLGEGLFVQRYDLLGKPGIFPLVRLVA